VTGQSIVQQVEPNLFSYDAQGVSQLNKDFLVSAAVTSTSPQVVTYKLNPKAKWSDGKQLSWQDFATQWKALNGTDDRYLGRQQRVRPDLRGHPRARTTRR